jgi:hypothetical protein
MKLVDFRILATDDDDDDAILVDAIVLVEAVDVVSAIRAIVTGLLKKASLPPVVVAVKIAVPMSWRLDMIEKEALLDDNNIATTRMSAGNSGRRLIVLGRRLRFIVQWAYSARFAMAYPLDGTKIMNES